MYTNIAYLGKYDEDIVNLSKPLLVTAAGYYKIIKLKMLDTVRPNGRGDYQLLYIASGKGYFYFDGKEYIVPKGNMVLFRPGVTQEYYIYSEDKTETYWVHFTGSAVDNLLDYYQISLNEKIIFAGTAPDYQWLFRQMIQELQLMRSNFEDLLNINLLHILLIIHRFRQEGNTIGTKTFDEVERATHFFHDHYNEPIVIQDYAKEHGLTANWFTQCFKRITKVTPMQYIISLRMTNAMSLIDNTDYNMTQIAYTVGYENSMYYFSRVFKKHTGMSPTEYKNRNKKVSPK